MILPANIKTYLGLVKTTDNKTRLTCSLANGERVKVKYSNDLIIELYKDDQGELKILSPKMISHSDGEERSFDEIEYSKRIDTTYIKKEV